MTMHDTQTSPATNNWRQFGRRGWIDYWVFPSLIKIASFFSVCACSGESKESSNKAGGNHQETLAGWSHAGLGLKLVYIIALGVKVLLCHTHRIWNRCLVEVFSVNWTDWVYLYINHIGALVDNGWMEDWGSRYKTAHTNTHELQLCHTNTNTHVL